MAGDGSGLGHCGECGEWGDFNPLGGGCESTA